MGTHMRKAMSTATDIPMLASRIAKDECVWRNVSRHDRACTYKSKLPNGHTTENDRTCANRGTVLYESRCNFPVISAFQLAIRGDSAGKKVVGEANMGPHDLLPRAITPDGQLKGADDWKITPTLVKYGASIGAGAVVLCGVTIGQFALIGAGSVVTRDVPPHALVFGNPARQHGYVCRCAHSLLHVRTYESKLLGWCEACNQECSIEIPA